MANKAFILLLFAMTEERNEGLSAFDLVWSSSRLTRSILLFLTRDEGCYISTTEILALVISLAKLKDRVAKSAVVGFGD